MTKRNRQIRTGFRAVWVCSSMVNTGKPRRGCSICAKRKLKCDETKPACNRCVKAGWKCPGYPAHVDLIFRNRQPPSQVGPSAVTNHKTTANIYLPGSYCKTGSLSPISPPLDERAISFFVHHYVLEVDKKIPPSEVHGYLPMLLRTDNAGLLRAVMVASGLAALANAGNSKPWRIDAYRKYGQALKVLRYSLHDSHLAVADHTLATILFLGTFEAVAGADIEGMKSFSSHIIAAARCIELRGPAQFRNTVSIRLFLELRRLIVMTVHQLQEPMPCQLGKWSSWILPAQSMETSPANRFAEINGHLASVRFRIKDERISRSSEVVALLLPIDRELELWARSLPVSWTYQSYPSPVSAASPYGYDIYPNFWVASMWNNYRSVRILINEHILSTTARSVSVEGESARANAIAVLRDMAAGVHRSVQYHLGHPDGSRTVGSRTGGMPACYQLIWPLFLSGMLRTTSVSTKIWVTAKLREIGIAMGLQLAITMSEKVSVSNASFSDHEAWIIGEWYPR